jgi:hypothetical protein
VVGYTGEQYPVGSGWLNRHLAREEYQQKKQLKNPATHQRKLKTIELRLYNGSFHEYSSRCTVASPEQ